jgi:hypothetical protein
MKNLIDSMSDINDVGSLDDLAGDGRGADTLGGRAGDEEAFGLGAADTPQTEQPAAGADAVPQGANAESDEPFGGERERQDKGKRRPMPPEERSRYAAARRKAEEERDREIARVRREEMDARMRYELREQLREINAIDPSVQTIEDILTRPTGARFEQLVQRGNTLADAFRLANIEELTYAAARAARQEALASVSSKEHMRRSTSRGQGAAAVPREVAQQYRMLSPKASDEEIARHYNEYINR